MDKNHIRWISIGFMSLFLVNGMMDLFSHHRRFIAIVMVVGSIIAIASTLRLIFNQK